MMSGRLTNLPIFIGDQIGEELIVEKNRDIEHSGNPTWRARKNLLGFLDIETVDRNDINCNTWDFT
jgi:hypothetical protein